MCPYYDLYPQILFIESQKGLFWKGILKTIYFHPPAVSLDTLH